MLKCDLVQLDRFNFHFWLDRFIHESKNRIHLLLWNPLNSSQYVFQLPEFLNLYINWSIFLFLFSLQYMRQRVEIDFFSRKQTPKKSSKFPTKIAIQLVYVSISHSSFYTFTRNCRSYVCATRKMENESAAFNQKRKCQQQQWTAIVGMVLVALKVWNLI